MSAFWVVFYFIFVFGFLAMMYLWFLVRHSKTTTKRKWMKGGSPCLCAVLGSGGHTTEMLEMVRKFDRKLFPNRIYVLAQTDEHSAGKVETVEADIGDGAFHVVRIPRSREVGQSYVTSLFTTAHAFLHSIALAFRLRPDVLLVNGPGTCIPVCLAVALLDILRLHDTHIVYVESICRVDKLSLSAAILYYSGLADDVIVQWPQLKDVYPRVVTLEDVQESAQKADRTSAM